MFNQEFKIGDVVIIKYKNLSKFKKQPTDTIVGMGYEFKNQSLLRYYELSKHKGIYYKDQLILIDFNKEIMENECIYKEVLMDHKAYICILYIPTGKSILISHPNFIERLFKIKLTHKINKAEKKLRGNYEEISNIIKYKNVENTVRQQVKSDLNSN